MGKPDLDSVTLVAVSSVAIPATIRALQASNGQARFGRTLLLSDRRPPREIAGIEWEQIQPLRSRADYSRFMLRELADRIRTSHVLCIQWDGYVIDGSAWEPGFLDFDYVGAPWPHFDDEHRVGNGGFSLRSKRLLEACKNLPLDRSEAEDILICRRWRPLLEQQGLRFAPEALARRFSYERTKPRGAEFGFHGVFNLVRLLAPAEALALFKSLEPGMMARGERWEVLGWALRHGRFRLALEMLWRLA